MNNVVKYTFAMLLISGMAGLTGCADRTEGRAMKLAEKALTATIAHPQSVEIIGISKPDSVFGQEYITKDEQMVLSMAMMKINEKVMKETNGMENFDPDNKEMASLMERQMEAMSSLRQMMNYSTRLSGKKPQDFTGWKVKVEYKSKDVEGRPYHAEHWFIMDKEAECVVKSFEIPLL